MIRVYKNNGTGINHYNWFFFESETNRFHGAQKINIKQIQLIELDEHTNIDNYIPPVTVYDLIVQYSTIEELREKLLNDIAEHLL